MMSRLAVIGSINADLSVTVDRHPRPGETVLGQSATLTPGGKGANQALAAARQGAATLMIGAVGTDANAEASTTLLRQGHVDLSQVVAIPGPTGLAIVAVASDGENNIIVVPGANASLSSEHVSAARDLLASCDVAVLQGEIPTATIDFASDTLGEVGVRQILNLAPVIPVEAATIRRADPLVVNEHEAAEILGMAPSAVEGTAAGTTVSGLQLAAALVKLGARSSVVTLGSAGAAIADRSGTRHVAAPHVTAVDTTGAGDAFVGALAADLARGARLAAACLHGSRVAAFSVGRRGAQESYPGRYETLPA